MALHYRFDPTVQAVIGIFGFLIVLPVQYLFSGQVSIISAVIVGIGNFLVAGFYTEYYRNPEACAGNGHGR